MSSLSLGDELGGYRLEQVAGRGGMGIVYRATQLRLDRTVALKVIAPELASDPLFRKRFQREARLMAAVEDPHVIPVYEADEAGGQLFLSMRWIEGGDLADEIARTGGLDADRATDLLFQVAGALDAVHAHGLVHGDMKPANVLLEARGGREHAYLSDFGAGRLLENTASAATATGQWLGTVEYVAPETIKGSPPDSRSDLYALACVLFETLTGAPPFHRDTAWATMWAHDNEPPPSARERRPALPRGVDAVLARGLAKDPDERYPSAERLMQALSDVLMAGRGQATGPVVRPPGAPAGEAGLEPLRRTTEPIAPVAEKAEAIPAAGADAGPRRRFPIRPGRRGILGALAGMLVIAGAVVAGLIATSGSGSPQRKTKPRAAPATIAGRTPLGAGTEAVRVAASQQGEYVLDQYGQNVDVLSDGSLSTRVSVPGKPQSLVLDPTHRMLWVGLLNDKLVAVSLSGNRIAQTISVPIRPDALAVVGSEVIVQQGNPGALARVNAVTGKVIGAPVTPGGSATAMVAYNGSVLVTFVFPAQLEQFNANLQRTSDRPIAAALPSAMALDSLGSLWVADYDAARVYRLNPADGSSEGSSLAVGQDPLSVAVSGEYVWVANAGDETVSVIEQSSGSQPQAVPLKIGGGIGWLAGDGEGNAYMPSGTNLLMLEPKF